MVYIWMALAATIAVVLDQVTKYLVVANIPLHGFAQAIPGLFHFTYVQNDGAAFSMLKGQQWLFAVLFVLLTAAVIFELCKRKMGFSRFEHWCIVFIWAGGLGNMIDRVRLGYVVDMVNLDFMDFAVFNVADCFITCGCIALVISLIFFNKGFWKDNKKK